MMDGRAPDGGWGWMIAASAFLATMFIDGVKYSFGVLFLELMGAFRGSKSETSLIMSLQLGAMLLSGPLSSALVNRFGCRRTALVGTFLAFIGFLASSFATSLIWLYVTFGIVAGVGFCLMNMPPYIMLSRYFDKRLSLAFGIGTTGSGIGTLLFNPLSKVLIDTYTWRGTILIEAGIILNGLLCALVLRPLPKKGLKMHAEENGIGKSEDDPIELRERLIAVDNDTEEEGFIDGIDKGDEKITLKKPNDFKEIHISNNQLHERGSKECAMKHSENIADTEDTEDTSEEKSKRLHENNEGAAGAKRWISFAPLKNPSFLLFILSNILTELALNVPFSFLPDLMVQKGYQRSQAVWILFIMGLMSTIARILLGFIADFQCINRAKLCGAILVVNGCLLVLVPFSFNYASFVAFGVIFGFTAGGSNSLRAVLIPHLFGVETAADTFGLCFFFSAISAFVGLPKSGALYDATGGYILPFTVAGAEYALSGLLVFSMPFFLRRFKLK
ncbi:monocarboxylate transporter 3-like [Mya arenaria]|uniref:monocarboxylate transporter 3-like n=1 Tax=Mya arenaria TaxID=6604 RepID=UPI0022E0E7B3|nr:monocarboxylate transporter 3-like [Mya arenaria]